MANIACRRFTIAARSALRVLRERGEPEIGEQEKKRRQRKAGRQIDALKGHRTHTLTVHVHNNGNVRGDHEPPRIP